MHPTAKPVALVMDAILDCSQRKAISPSKYRLAPGSDHKLFVEREQASLIAG